MKKQFGYIAISTAIILSIVIILVAISLGSANLFTRFNYLDFDNKQASYLTARSCLNYALLKLTDNAGYAGNETINVASYTCTIQPIEVSGSNTIIKAHSQVSGATTNLKLTVTTATLSTVSLEELVKF